MLIQKFSLKDKIFFLKELAYLLKWWLSIPVALETIKNNTEKKIIQDICDKIFMLIKRWETLSRSLTALDEYFTEWDVKIISAWESIWELPRVLKQLADEYENLYLIKMKYITSMIYPTILLFIVFLSLYVIFVLILPWFINIIQSFPWSVLPPSTQFLISVNHFLHNNWWIFLVFFLIILTIIWLFLSTEEGKKVLISFLMKVPIIWRIYKLYYVVFFLRYFSLLIYSWLPINKVFLHLKWVISDPYYKDMCDEILENINRWESFVSVLKKYTYIIPSDVVVLLKVWEETATLQQASENAISLYEEEFNKIVDNLSKVIEPILIVFIWGIVGFVAISIFSVITSVLDSLHI